MIPSIKKETRELELENLSILKNRQPRKSAETTINCNDKSFRDRM